MSHRKLLLGALLICVASTFLAASLTGAVPLPWRSDSPTAEARTAVLSGGVFSPVAGPTASPLAAAPGLVSFQGLLTDPGTGLPVADATYSMRFSVWNAASAGSEQWNETQNVTTAGGLFNVLLGSVTPLTRTVFDGDPRYLEVKVGADPAMTPRQRFTTTPYAFRAEQAGALSRRGFSLTAVDEFRDVGTWTSITIGADGLPIISYRDSTNLNLKVVHCGNAGCTAGNTTTTVDDTGDVGEFNSITIGADGLPVISYRDSTSPGLKVLHCGNAACTAGNTITLVLEAAGGVRYTSITIGADGLPVIALETGILQVLHCDDIDCSGGTTLTDVDDRSDARYISITIGADGLPVISYHDLNRLDLKVAHCGNAACTAGNTVTTVDGSGGIVSPRGDVGEFTSITIGADGLPVISYFADVSELPAVTALNVAHCGNAACTAGNRRTAVDEVGDVGTWTSITIGADGLPVISYRDSTNLSLKVLHCGSADCTGFSAITVDADGDVGEFTSITIGMDGLPVISYQDFTNGDLKVAHCSNRFCTPFHRPR